MISSVVPLTKTPPVANILFLHSMLLVILFLLESDLLESFYSMEPE